MVRDGGYGGGLGGVRGALVAAAVLVWLPRCLSEWRPRCLPRRWPRCRVSAAVEVVFLLNIRTLRYLSVRTVGWSDFEFFWNLKNRHPTVVVGFNFKTKIEKTVVIF